MLFHTPVSRITQPNYSEGNSMRSVRDASNTDKQWLKSRVVKSQGLSDNIGFAQIIQRLNKLQRRQIGYQSQQPAFFPFKIYTIGNSSATDVQKAFYAAAGQDINNFTYQIRSGIIGYRSQYTVITDVDLGVYEISMFCPNTDLTAINFDSAPVANTGQTIILSNAVDTLIWDASTETITTPLPQIALDPTFDDVNLCESSFWIKIIDDPILGIYPQLWGRMFSRDGSAGRPNVPLPSDQDSSIVPIGEASIVQNTPSENTIYQYISGNLTNRYAALAPLGSPLGPVNIQRGYWTSDSLSGQAFYTGDVVVDDSFTFGNIALIGGSFTGGSAFGVYTWQGGVQILTNPPNPGNVSPGNFVMTGIVLLDIT